MRGVSKAPRFKMVRPNYSARSPIVNDSHFSDTPIAKPTLGSPQASFNPGRSSSMLPSGPPKFVQPAGKRVYAKGLTNKRYQQNV